MHRLVRDVRLALRSLRRTPAFASVVARLGPGATPAAARTEFLAIFRRIDQARPVTFAPERAEAPTLTDVVLGDVRPMLGALTAAVALLLTVACVSVGNLLLLRVSGRAREIAVRRALAVAGAGAGVFGALASSRLLASLLYEVRLTDPVALLGACVLLLAVAALAAFVPARQATRIDPARALRAD